MVETRMKKNQLGILAIITSLGYYGGNGKGEEGKS